MKVNYALFFVLLLQSEISLAVLTIIESLFVVLILDLLVKELLKQGVLLQLLAFLDRL